MTNYEELLNEQCEAISQINKSETLVKLWEEIVNSNNELKPSVMVYGVYNAGKSTLINALMGEAKAEVADRPMTDKVKDYDWCGYKIWDTPGIDAPKEHEQVTNEQLIKTDVVLMVVSNETFENRYVYEKLALLAKQKKPLLLIVNTKQQIDEEGKAATLNRISDNLQKIGSENGITTLYNNVGISFVNAQSGLKGKLENKLALLENSGLPQLEKQITEFLAICGAKTKANTFANRLKLIINEYQSNIRNEIKNLHGTQASILKDRTIEAKNGLRIRLNAQIKEEIRDYEEDLRLALENAKYIESTIEVIRKKIGDIVREELIEERDKLAVYFDKIFTNEISNLESDIDIDISETTFNATDELGGSFDHMSGAKAAAFAFKNTPPLPPIVVPTPWGPVPLPPQTSKVVAAAIAYFTGGNTAPSKEDIDAYNQRIEQEKARQTVAINRAVKDIFYELEKISTIYTREVLTDGFIEVQEALDKLILEEEKNQGQLKAFNNNMNVLLQSQQEIDLFIANN
jgi:GTP-binding protein EngB required for normal cell division